MGWLKLKRAEAGLVHTPTEPKGLTLNNFKSTTGVEHIENVTEGRITTVRPQIDPSTSNAALPFITKDEVDTTKRNGNILWIVVDNIVYDCTDFINQHPGGATVIRSFSGEDCSWQFWRIHARRHLEDFGRELRVGRTEGVKNRFAMVPRYVGLRRFGNDEW